MTLDSLGKSHRNRSPVSQSLPNPAGTMASPASATPGPASPDKTLLVPSARPLTGHRGVDAFIGFTGGQETKPRIQQSIVAAPSTGSLPTPGAAPSAEAVRLAGAHLISDLRPDSGLDSKLKQEASAAKQRFEQTRKEVWSDGAITTKERRGLDAAGREWQIADKRVEVLQARTELDAARKADGPGFGKHGPEVIDATNRLARLQGELGQMVQTHSQQSARDKLLDSLEVAQGPGSPFKPQVPEELHYKGPGSIPRPEAGSTSFVRNLSAASVVQDVQDVAAGAVQAAKVQATPVPLTDAAKRTELLAGTGQVNPVSQKANNDGLICGGAAATAALVMSSKTPQDCAANAKAIETTCDHLNVTPTQDQKTAIDHMRQGKLSPVDVQHLQQLLYSAGKEAGNGVGGATEGMGPQQMFALAGHLKAAGAFPGSDVRFHQNNTSFPQGDALHWTCSVDNQHYNSVSSDPKQSGLAVLNDGGPPSRLTTKNQASWETEVRIGKTDVTAEYRTGAGESTYAVLRAGIDQLKRAPVFPTLDPKTNQEIPSRTELLKDHWRQFADRDQQGIRYHPIS